MKKHVKRHPSSREERGNRRSALFFWAGSVFLFIFSGCWSIQSFSVYSHSYVNAIFSDANNKAVGRYAVAHYVESNDQIYGIYSIHKQMVKHNISASHVVVVPTDIYANYSNALVSWLGEDNVRAVDTDIILGSFNRSQGLWQGVFNKLWLFNLTEFDKVTILDADVLVRTNIMHWFDFHAMRYPIGE